MTAMTGECADGIQLDPVVTTKYIDEEVLPNLARGAARAGRDVDEVEVCLKPLIGTAPNEERLEQVIRTVRAPLNLFVDAVVSTGVCHRRLGGPGPRSERVQPGRPVGGDAGSCR